ncbi:DUF6145 family protein [Butyrivibrio sp. NC3005]|uniref:DUF6145 family protein n=1 Tax=Butyrivibrio sp. NC3005 TaxID=1280685 RepID=UPI0003FFFC52|nr:DUF6145 family protein [Butyrivibrio sp. NC3005]
MRSEKDNKINETVDKSLETENVNEKQSVTDSSFNENISASENDKGVHADTLEMSKEDPCHLIINKKTGRVTNAKTGEEIETIDIVTKDGMLGSISASGRIVLCGANAYEQKYYFNPLFSKIPASIQKELRIICVLFTQEAGGVFTIEFENDGEITLETNADEEDITYDEISAGLLIGEVRRQRQDVFEALATYYKVLVLHQNAADVLMKEDETIGDE